MKDVYVYSFDGKTYINLTNRCNNNCDFCIRKNADRLNDYRLLLKKEPEAVDVIAALKAEQFVSEEVIFCGYGEPTMRFEVLREVAEYLKNQGKRVRLNTNGLAGAHYGRNVAGELKDIVDIVSVSLNEASAEKYDSVCHSVYGKEAYGYMLDFAKSCVEAGIETVLTVVDVIPAEDIDICRKNAEDMGARLRVRGYVSDNGNSGGNVLAKKKAGKFLKRLPFALIIIAAYLVMGIGFSLWHPGWLIFLSVPVFYAITDIISRKRAHGVKKRR